jgi:ABC-type transport system substrate-binding protein
MSADRQKLRQAISIAVNYEEFISIFMNERGMAAQGPIPPGIFGHLEGEEGVILMYMIG